MTIKTNKPITFAAVVENYMKEANGRICFFTTVETWTSRKALEKRLNRQVNNSDEWMGVMSFRISPNKVSLDEVEAMRKAIDDAEVARIYAMMR